MTICSADVDNYNNNNNKNELMLSTYFTLGTYCISPLQFACAILFGFRFVPIHSDEVCLQCEEEMKTPLLNPIAVVIRYITYFFIIRVFLLLLGIV